MWQPRDRRGRFMRALAVPRPPLLLRPCRRCAEISALVESLRDDPAFTFLPNGKIGLTKWYEGRPGFEKLRRDTDRQRRRRQHARLVLPGRGDRDLQEPQLPSVADGGSPLEVVAPSADAALRTCYRRTRRSHRQTAASSPAGTGRQTSTAVPVNP